MSTTSLDRQVERRLSEHEARYTAGRRAVVATLAGAEGPLSASELQRSLGALPLSSIYRSLAVLEESGVLAPHHGARGVTRYELAEWLRGHHHHLICIECGTVEDVEVDADHESDVERIVEEIGEASSFVTVTHALEIEGMCARCA